MQSKLFRGDSMPGCFPLGDKDIIHPRPHTGLHVPVFSLPLACQPWTWYFGYWFACPSLCQRWAWKLSTGGHCFESPAGLGQSGGRFLFTKDGSMGVLGIHTPPPHPTARSSLDTPAFNSATKQLGNSRPGEKMDSQSQIVNYEQLGDDQGSWFLALWPCHCSCKWELCQ